MKLRLWLTLGLAGIVVGAFSGCKKKPEAPTAAVTDAPPASATAPATPPTGYQAPTHAVTAVATNANGSPDLAKLSRQLRGWIVGNRRVPQNFEEFAASLNPPPPPPPPGKKYVIQKSTVLLVDK